MTPDLLKQLLDDRAARRAVVLITEIADGSQSLVYPGDAAGELEQAVSEAFRYDKSQMVKTANGEVFINVFNPPLRMVIIGAVHTAQALAPMAAIAGYDVTVIDPRGAFATPERFPEVTVRAEWPDEVLADFKIDQRTAMVALTHDPKIDDPALTAALASPCFYIGALGSKRTHAGRLERLGAAGIASKDLARICGPIGLDIGARGPAEIAVSILAEVTQALRRGEGPA